MQSLWENRGQGTRVTSGGPHSQKWEGFQAAVWSDLVRSRTLIGNARDFPGSFHDL